MGRWRKERSTGNRIGNRQAADTLAKGGVFAVADKPDTQLTDWRAAFASALRERDTGLTGPLNPNALCIAITCGLADKASWRISREQDMPHRFHQGTRKCEDASCPSRTIHKSVGPLSSSHLRRAEFFSILSNREKCQKQNQPINKIGKPTACRRQSISTFDPNPTWSPAD
jgi:hypothetical protein